MNNEEQKQLEELKKRIEEVRESYWRKEKRR
jgi:hypothetical protein